MRVLFIEDDFQLGKAVSEGLNQEFAADWFQTSEDGQAAIEGADYDVIVLDTNSKTVAQNSKNINLSPLEFDILHLLIKNTGRAYSKEQITEKIYNWDDEVESNTIEVHISSIRRKLGKDLIKTIRNVGYLIENE
jgi:DNA-binding response OmpR family regulator